MKSRFLAALLVLLAAAPAFANDGRLQTFRSVQKQVLQYPHFTIFDSIHAEIADNGVVRLTGKVTMPYKSTDIERRVAKVDGVASVDNRISVLPVSSFDDELRYRIARAIYGNPAFHQYAFRANPPIHGIVEHGRVTLEGVVISNVDRVLARSIAGNFLAFDVKNELKTEAEVRDELEKI